LKILIADDEALSRRLLEKTLERAGYEVVAVENGRAAVRQLCQADGPRLALLDWVMPELDGPGVCREVRRQQDESYVYMVLLTSKESKEDIVAGLESGADDYLTKPFNVDELKARLRTGERILHLEGRLVEAREMMRFKATHDALTSIWNRGVIVDLLGRELVRSQRESGCTIVLLGDVDHFKSVNDTHGHLVGDEVLQEISRRLLLSIRSYDFVGRYGGEEFLLVLNNCTPQFAEARAEDIRKIVGNRPIQTLAGPLNITMSFGLLLSDGWGVRPVEELMHEVDAALYAAKAAGRNCVRVASLRSSLTYRWCQCASRRNDYDRMRRCYFDFASCCKTLRIAAVDPGARCSRQASRRLHVVSIFKNIVGFLNAARHAGTITRIRSHTTQISPLLSKNNSSSISPRFTMLATISQ